MDASGRLQLQALARLARALEAEQIEYWVFGGWAVDLHLGEVTRAHEDLDLAVWQHDLSAIETLLAREGWTTAPLDDPQGGSAFSREGVRLELTHLVRDDDARVLTPLSGGPAYWSTEALGDDVAELAGVRARVVALEALRRGKATPRDDPEEAARDRADYERLTRLAR